MTVVVTEEHCRKLVDLAAGRISDADRCADTGAGSVPSITADGEAEPADDSAGSEAQDRRRALTREQLRLCDELRVLSAERQLLLETFDGEDDYRGAVEAQAGRLASLSLLPDRSVSQAQAPDTHSCPVCGSALDEPDPRPEDMQSALEQLQRQLAGIDEARPARRTALADLDDRAAGLRDQLRAADAAMHALIEGDGAVETVAGEERRAFTRGRISAILTTLVPDRWHRVASAPA